MFRTQLGRSQVLMPFVMPVRKKSAVRHVTLRDVALMTHGTGTVGVGHCLPTAALA